jgi:hypothetical protein
LAAALAALPLTLGFALAMTLAIPENSRPIIALAGSIVALMAWDHFRPRQSRKAVAFARDTVRLRVPEAVALSDALHVRVEVPEQDRAHYRAALVCHEHVAGAHFASPPRDAVHRITHDLAARDGGCLETWLRVPEHEIPSLDDGLHCSVSWSLQVHREDELVAEQPLCVLPVRARST